MAFVDFSFVHPEYLWVLLIIPIIFITHLFMLKRSKSVSLRFANFEALERVSKGSLLATPYCGRLFNRNFWLLLLRLFTYVILVFSITGFTVWYEQLSSDNDYVFAIDVSSSMLADDFSPTRLDSAKSSALNFLDYLSSGASVGVVTFSGVAKVESRISSNLDDIRNIISNVWLLDSGGTNIGEAIITSDNLFTNAKRGKTVILLTDGQSNIGPGIVEAANYSLNNKVIIYSIGMATLKGGFFVNGNVTSKLDEDSLKYVSSKTGGTFFKAEDKASLDSAFKEISKSSKKRVSFDLSWVLLLVGFGFLIFEWLLVNTKYRVFPFQ